MNTLAQTTLGAPTAPDARRPERAPLYDAVDAAPVARPFSFRERLRHPFARREPTVRSLIRKHRLLPALEYAYDEVVREFGSARITVEVEGIEDGFPYLSLHAYLPTVDLEHVLEYEQDLSQRVRPYVERKHRFRLLLTLHRDPEYLPLFA
jgi:hypothetical protein